eukprot:292889_1
MNRIHKLKSEGTIVSPTAHRLQHIPSFSAAACGGGGSDSINKCIIIDNGSGYIKCGFGCNLSERDSAPHGPNIIFPTAYYKNKNRNKQNNSRILLGIDSIHECERLGIPFMKPIRRGYIINWNEMEYIWNNILMTERYNTPFKYREKLLEIIFESFNISSLYLRDSSSLSIYGTGRTKGIVLDIGHDITSIITIDGNDNNEENKVIEFGGYDISLDLQKEYGIKSYFHSNKIKEEYYSIPYERSDILFADQNTEIYKLPDGNEIKLGKNRMIKPLHLLFDKSSDNKYGGINVSKLVKNCILSNKSAGPMMQPQIISQRTKTNRTKTNTNR